MPEEFSLSQNYPNPFNPSTSIKYALREDIHVSLKVFDLLGKEVRTLVDETQKAGYKSITWDGRSADGNAVSSGIYFYRLIAGDPNNTGFKDVKKMIIVR